MRSKEGFSGSQRLKAGEQLRSEETPGAWVGEDQRCHRVPSYQANGADTGSFLALKMGLENSSWFTCIGQFY